MFRIIAVRHRGPWFTAQRPQPARPLLFGARGITPIGYASFAFHLGVTAGVLIRRTIPAMAATLAVFTGALIVMPTWVRPHLTAAPGGQYSSAGRSRRTATRDRSGWR